MTEPLDDARGELLALARMLKAISLRVEMSGDWRLSEGEHAVLDTAYPALLRCATIIRPAPARCDAEIGEGLDVLRELEVAWLTAHLSDSIANLGYPVGMGMAPHPEQIKKAATTLFERYAKMIAMARGCSISSTTLESPPK